MDFFGDRIFISAAVADFPTAGFLTFLIGSDFASTKRNDPEAPVPFICFRTPDATPRFNPILRCALTWIFKTFWSHFYVIYKMKKTATQMCRLASK